MSRLRSQKTQIRSFLETPRWQSNLDRIAEARMASIGPLLTLLTYEPVLRQRAAIALGLTTAVIHKEHPEIARDIMRRLMWRMSEESGNIGWGVPEAIGEVLGHCPALAKDFHRILFTTVLDLGFDDNYVDNDVLRRSCFFAIGRFLASAPEYGDKVRQLLIKGLNDPDPVCRGMAAWALGKIPAKLDAFAALRTVEAENNRTQCLITDGDRTAVCSVSELAGMTLKNIDPLK